MTLERSQERTLDPSDPNDLSPRTELERVNRVVVYGSNLSGAPDVVDGLTELLEQRGIPDASVRQVRNIDLIEDGFFGLPPGRSGTIPPERTLPRGVVVLPIMRFYDSAGTDVNTFRSRIEGAVPFDRIRALCQQFNVPYIIVDRQTTPTSLSDSLTKALGPVPQAS